MDRKEQQSKQSLAILSLTALGIVYGDIGTSPLYAVKEVFNPNHGIALSTENILGGLSAIFWSLIIVVSIKYVVLIMRADNKGEGGIMALLALASASTKKYPGLSGFLILLGIFGAALFYGDAVITPAISVLSAMEGLEIATPALKPFVVPLTLIILIVLFMFQRKGTAFMGTLFGPIMILWFTTLAVIGIFHIAKAPQILDALNPSHAFLFLTEHGFASFMVLGSVFLVTTGAEALYADMGHFGKRATRVAWFSCVLPGLLLNYFGQGALLIVNPKAVENPFYLMFPNWALYPMIALSAAATIIASQAVITGTYSMTKQAIQLGLLPRTNILQTSARQIGQIYIPTINWILFMAIVAAVLSFGTSTNLASAYGLAVSGTMLITTVLTFFVLRYHWKLNLPLVLFATTFFLLIDGAFFSANAMKFIDGGWFPLTMGAVIFTLMTTWRRGRTILFQHLRKSAIPLEPFLKSLFTSDGPQCVPGTAIFLVADSNAVPHALLHNLAHNKVIHERIIFLTVVITDIPYVSPKERVSVEKIENDCYRIKLNFGFMDVPDVPKALELCKEYGLEFHNLETSFFLSRETVISVSDGGMATWREQLFVFMTRNTSSIVEYFNIPTNRVIELGTQIEI